MNTKKIIILGLFSLTLPACTTPTSTQLCERGQEPTCDLCVQMKQELDNGNYRKVREEEKALRQCIEDLVDTCRDKLKEAERIGEGCGTGTEEFEQLRELAESDVSLSDLRNLIEQK